MLVKVEAWEKRLGLLSETLDEWVAVQRNWMYLETIFCAEDIQKQLPDEAAKFQAVDKMWKVGTVVVFPTREHAVVWRGCVSRISRRGRPNVGVLSAEAD